MYGPDADRFMPERWIKSEIAVPPPYHFAFGAGARMCTAVNFSNRVLYAIFVRIIILFRMTESKIMPANTHYVDYKSDSTASNAIALDFKVKFTVRDGSVLTRCFARSEEQCKSILTQSETGI
jgi:phenylacetate 2-hydroxylase